MSYIMITGTKSLSFGEALRRVKLNISNFVSIKVKMKEKNEHYNQNMISLGTYLII